MVPFPNETWPFVIIGNVVVPQARLERALLSEQDFESSASTIPPLGHIFYGQTRQSGGPSNRGFVAMQAHPYFFSSFASVLSVALPYGALNPPMPATSTPVWR